MVFKAGVSSESASFCLEVRAVSSYLVCMSTRPLFSFVVEIKAVESAFLLLLEGELLRPLLEAKGGEISLLSELAKFGCFIVVIR